MARCYKTTLQTAVLYNLGSLNNLPYCSIQNVKAIFRNSTQVISTLTIPHSILNLKRTFHVIKTITIQRYFMLIVIIVIIQTWLWRIFYSIWQTCYFCYHIWLHQPDLGRSFYIPDCVLGSSSLPPGRGTSFVNTSSSSGILPFSSLMLDNYSTFCTRYLYELKIYKKNFVLFPTHCLKT